MSNIGMKLKYNVLTLLFLAVAAVMFVPFISSCNKESANASPTGLNTQLNIIHLCPDLLKPVDLFINLRQQNARSFVYGTPSGYLYLSSLATPLEIRSAQANQILFSRGDTALRQNTRYTVFITGLVAENTRTYIFVTDTDAAPKQGNGKVRFINASARSVNVDVAANGVTAFSNRGFKAVTKYLELPAGIYDFKIYQNGTTTVLTDLPNTPIQDGRLYTLYTQGVVGRADSAAFAAKILTNR
ncbi:DUF4397 domain-containing protein [Mucilaginibacter boryungensis]|uniref:DUF4397 domain-containing protein n=1 Tax=Mucilaginibacter boryungensis TaxID=768480 RepID=A0ABR9XC37_9SPHI|nr:DUF4397 domain-containing protein [Mucilaginibacter boryungensis]MBE9664943.1 DUF4397 domain-containing protein [Mucilaginibacter boryungensis]